MAIDAESNVATNHQPITDDASHLPQSLHAILTHAFFSDQTKTAEELSTFPSADIIGTACQKFFFQLPPAKQIAILKIWKAQGYALCPPQNIHFLCRYAKMTNDDEALELFAAWECTPKTPEEYEQLDQKLLHLCKASEVKQLKWKDQLDTRSKNKILPLLENGANPNFQDGPYQTSVLTYTIGFSLHACAETLLSFGADPNAQELKKHYYPLSLIGEQKIPFYTESEHVTRIRRIFQTLREAGADINRTSSKGVTPSCGQLLSDLSKRSAFFYKQGQILWQKHCDKRTLQTN